MRFDIAILYAKAHQFVPGGITELLDDDTEIGNYFQIRHIAFLVAKADRTSRNGVDNAVQLLEALAATYRSHGDVFTLDAHMVARSALCPQWGCYKLLKAIAELRRLGFLRTGAPAANGAKGRQTPKYKLVASIVRASRPLH